METKQLTGSEKEAAVFLSLSSVQINTSQSPNFPSHPCSFFSSEALNLPAQCLATVERECTYYQGEFDCRGSQGQEVFIRQEYSWVFPQVCVFAAVTVNLNVNTVM